MWTARGSDPGHDRHDSGVGTPRAVRGELDLAESEVETLRFFADVEWWSSICYGEIGQSVAGRISNSADA